MHLFKLMIDSFGYFSLAIMISPRYCNYFGFPFTK